MSLPACLNEEETKETGTAELSPAPSLHLFIDDTFTADEAADVQRAADAWNARTTRRIITVTNADAWRTAHPDGQLWTVMKAQVPSDHCGRSDNARRLIRLDPECGSDRVYATTLHELGHALGLGHLCDASWNYEGEAPSGRVCDPGHPLGVMDPSDGWWDGTGYRYVEFSDDDMVECRRVGACE